MNLIQDLRQGIGRVWQDMVEGWEQLRERAGDALTRFYPERQVQSGSGDLARRGGWSLLAADVRDADDEIEVRLEVPGMRAEDFEIEAHGRLLCITGVKHAEREEQAGDLYIMQRAYGRFERQIPLPVPVDDSAAKAGYERGVLTVRLPKMENARRRSIRVQPH